MFCLPVEIADKFLDKLKSGEIDPSKLSQMTSDKRRDLFKTMMNEESAQATNALFESKLLLKNQKRGMVNWAKQVSGLKPEAQKDILAKISKMENILKPENEKAFLEDLASHKLGATVTSEEASKIVDLASEVSKQKEAVNPNSPRMSKDRMDYGRALVKLGDYVSDLKNETNKLTLKDLRSNPGKTVLKAFSNLAGLTKSLKATLDNSVIGRQGLKTMFSHPKIWLKNSAQTFVDIAKTFGGKNVIDEVRADIYSRPNALNGLYRKEKLAIGNVEESYPTNWPEKIYGLGRVFKASEAAFLGWQYRTRADVFDKLVEIAQKSGADIEGIGKVTNSLTGRGTFGPRAEGVATELNNVFFSPRFLKSNVDLLTSHAFDSNINKFARKEAALNMIRTVSGIAGILGVANIVNPGSVEWDPRSSDFGKIKIGNTRFDITAGLSSLVVLASRIITQSTKSGGNVKKLNTGKWGSRTVGDVVADFFQNKLSPVASVLNDIQFRGTDFHGNKPTFFGEMSNLLVPLPAANAFETMKDPGAANMVAVMIADGLGVSTNTYSSKPKKDKALDFDIDAEIDKELDKAFKGI